MNTGRKRVAFHTLGCKLNFAETSTISRSFPDDQFEKVPAGSKADIYIINTCSVTDTADRKCRQAIRKFITRSPGAFIAVVGCYAQLKPQEISGIPGVDLVLGANEKFDIAYYLESLEKRKKGEIHSCDLAPGDRFNASWSFGDRTRSFLKVQDGCDYDCSYCTIPKARGGSKNPEIRSLVKEAEEIASKGIREIVLTGVNMGDFGKSTGENFHNLLKELVKVQGIERIRLSSIEPNLLKDRIIELASAEKKILPHFHIPLQSGSDRILGLMRRRYKRQLFEDRIMTIRKYLPLAGIGADVIVGFPGESDADFNETFDFINSLPLSYLHVFTYSERPGTPAATMPGRVTHELKEARSKKLIALSSLKEESFNESNLGTNAEVLFEHTKSGNMISGYTGNYIRVEYPWDSDLAGEIRKIRLTGISPTGNMNIKIVE